MAETYVKVNSQWKYLYRAIDSSGQIINSRLTTKQDIAAALGFVRKVIKHHSKPDMVTIDKSRANTAAFSALNAGKSKDDTITVRHQKYLNNRFEQDHRNIKRHIRSIS